MDQHVWAPGDLRALGQAMTGLQCAVESVRAQTLRQGLGRFQVSTLTLLKTRVTLGNELMIGTHPGGRIYSLVSSRTWVAGAPASRSQNRILFLVPPVPLAPSVPAPLPSAGHGRDMPSFCVPPSSLSRPSRSGSCVHGPICGTVPCLHGSPGAQGDPQRSRPKSAPVHLPFASHRHFSCQAALALHAASGGCWHPEELREADKEDGAPSPIWIPASCIH